VTYFFEWSRPWGWKFQRCHHGHVKRWIFGWWSWGWISMDFGRWLDGLLELAVRKGASVTWEFVMQAEEFTDHMSTALKEGEMHDDTN